MRIFRCFLDVWFRSRGSRGIISSKRIVTIIHQVVSESKQYDLQGGRRRLLGLLDSPLLQNVQVYCQEQV